MSRPPLLALSILLAGLHTGAIADVVHVPADQPTIQAGIDAASSGDTVVVACGVYEEWGILMKSGVHLTSETGNSDCVTIDGLTLGRVLYCEDVGDGATISGFTITGGRAVEDDSCIARASSGSPVSRGSDADRPWWEPYAGAGLSCKDSQVSLERVVFNGNEADYGGGLALVWESSVTLYDVVFTENTAGEYGGGALAYLNSELHMTRVLFEDNYALWWGGGLFCSRSDAYISDTVFERNACHESGGGMMFGDWNYISNNQLLATDVTFADNWTMGFGGGLWCRRAFDSVLSGVNFHGNEADGEGGGLFLLDRSPLIADCTFTDNHSGKGGGVFVRNLEPHLRRCTFVANTAGQGGAIGCLVGSADMTSCTFVANSSSNRGSVAATHSPSDISFHNCILAFSEGGAVVSCYLDNYNIHLNCCDVYGNEGGDWIGCIAGQAGANGNLCADPLFCLDASPDQPYSLHADSPCAPEHSQGCDLVGAWEVGCDATAVQRASWGSIKALYRQ